MYPARIVDLDTRETLTEVDVTQFLEDDRQESTPRLFKKSVSICLLNVFGQLESKLENSDFTKLITDYDIVIFNESWTNKESVLKLEGFAPPIVKNRKKRRNARRCSNHSNTLYQNESSIANVLHMLHVAISSAFHCV